MLLRNPCEFIARVLTDLVRAVFVLHIVRFTGHKCIYRMLATCDYVAMMFIGASP